MNFYYFKMNNVIINHNMCDYGMVYSSPMFKENLIFTYDKKISCRSFGTDIDKCIECKDLVKYLKDNNFSDDSIDRYALLMLEYLSK